MRSGLKRNGMLFALGAVLVCGCSEKEPIEQKEEGPTVIKLSMLFSKGSIYHRAAKKWAELIEEESGKEIRLEICPGGELLGEKGGDQFGLLESGAADLAVFRPSELAHLSRSLDVLYFPFLFPNRRSADALLEGSLGGRLLEGLEEGGIVGLGYFSGPFLQLSSTRRIVSPRDMEGLKVRLPQSRSGPIDARAMRLLKAEEVHMAMKELRPAAADGRIDGQVSTLGLYNKLDLERWQKHLTMLNYSFEPMVVCASSAFWNSLSREQQEILLSTLGESARYQRELLAEEEGLAKKKIYEKGISVVELIPEELDLFRRMVEKKHVDMAPGVETTLISEVVKEADRNREPYLYRFYDNLGSARVEAPQYSSEVYKDEKLPARGEGSALARIGDAYGFDERYGIFCPVPSRLEYEVVAPPKAKLEFGIGVRPRAHKQFPDGVTFTIDIEREGGRERQRIYERTLNPFLNKGERQWVDELLDIDLPPGERATIVFSAESAGQEKKAGGMYYGAIWTNPVLYEEDGDIYQRNVILISIDTLRADALGCYGNKHDASPNIDRTVEKGTIFLNCISQDTWTLPSHMSIMTSLYPSQHNIGGLFWNEKKPVKLSPGYLTLAEVMRDRGYNTVAFAESGFVDSTFGFNQGFNSYSNFWQWGREREDGSLSDLTIEHKPLVFRDSIDLNKMLSGSFRSTHITFSRALEWIRKRGGRKFFCFIHTYECHLPYFENPYVRLFSPQYSGIIPDTLTCERENMLRNRSYSGHLKIAKRDQEHLWALYSAQVRFIDGFIGQLLESLRAADFEHQTLIVFTSDHGERLYSHGSFVDHTGSPHEPVIRVPLIVRCDSIVPRGKMVSPQVASLDIFPTVLDFAGCRKPSVLEGMSLYPSIVKSTSLSEGRPIYVENDENTRWFEGENRTGWRIGLRFRGKKLIYYPSTGYRELFDISSDPDEVENIAGLSEETKQLESMVKRFIRRFTHGYFLVFTRDGSKHTFEGELTVKGLFKTIYCQGIEWKYRKGDESPSIWFKTRAKEPGECVINFYVYPSDARITFDLRVDGKRDPAEVFLGDSLGHPDKLPWEFDDSIKSERNPYSFAAFKNVGCYVCRINSPYLVDKDARAGLRLAKAREHRLEEVVKKEEGVTAIDEEQKERMEQVMKKLNAIGQVDKSQLKKKSEEERGKHADDDKEDTAAEQVRERLKALGYVQ